MDKQEYFKRIPKVDAVLREPEIEELCDIYGRGMVLTGIRIAMEHLRETIQRETGTGAEKALANWKTEVLEAVASLEEPSLKKVFNATGVILHTNMGRAPLGKVQRDAALLAMSGYSNLEYDLERGSRGKRWEHYARLIAQVTGAEGAIAVNNNAASVTLILKTLAEGREVIVSRGELIEIGGRFRIPDVMEQSGAVLRETGCTNRTRISDYERAINENTAALLKVHTSNYRIQGFTEEASVEELVRLGKKYGLPVIVDLGSGVLVDLERFGLSHEPTVQETLKKGADLVCFSGDKLLGGPQAGIIAGKQSYIKAMENHPLMRAFRLDKCTIAALTATFREYLDEERAIKNIPVLEMLSCPAEELQRRAVKMAEALRETAYPGEFRAEKSASAAGGGALPAEEFPSFAVTVKPQGESCEKLALRLRKLPIPVIARIQNEKIWLDMRTVLREEILDLKKELCDFFGGCL